MASRATRMVQRPMFKRRLGALSSFGAMRSVSDFRMTCRPQTMITRAEQDEEAQPGAQ